MIKFDKTWFRVDPKLKLSGVPTFLKYGDLNQKLVESQLFKEIWWFIHKKFMAHKFWLIVMSHGTLGESAMPHNINPHNYYQIKSLILSKWCSKKNNWREFYMWRKKIISSWFQKYTENKIIIRRESFSNIIFRLINVMRVLDEFLRYLRLFEPVGKISQKEIDEIISTFESKGKFSIVVTLFSEQHILW